MLLMVSCSKDDEKPVTDVQAQYSLINRLDGTLVTPGMATKGVRVVELEGAAAPCSEAPAFFANIEKYCAPQTATWTDDYTALIDGKRYPLQYFMPGSMINLPIDRIEVRTVNFYDEAHPAGSNVDDLIEVAFFSLDDWFAYKAGTMTAAEMYAKLGWPEDTDPEVLKNATYTPIITSLVKDFKGTNGVISNRVEVRPINLTPRSLIYEFEILFYSGNRPVAARLQYLAY